MVKILKNVLKIYHKIEITKILKDMKNPNPGFVVLIRIKSNMAYKISKLI